MKIFAASQMQTLEAQACTYTSLSDMMELAGKAVADLIMLYRTVEDLQVTILCGKGNNGGDGFVCARHLAEQGAQVTVLLAQGSVKTDLAQHAFAQMPDEVRIITEVDDTIYNVDVIVDALFGFQFRGALEGELAVIVTLANQSNAWKISVDLPSGMICDTGEVAGACFCADDTVTFTAYKPALLITPASNFAGSVHIADVGIKMEDIVNFPVNMHAITKETVRNKLPKRTSDSHKGTYGKLLMFCGSYGMLGAVMLAGKAALRCGVGLLEIVTSPACYPILAGQLPEVVFHIWEPGEDTAMLTRWCAPATACLIGCGLGDGADDLLSQVLPLLSCPLVIDADGLNALSRNPEFYTDLQQPWIATPHPKEMARLSGKTASQVQAYRLQTACDYAQAHGAILALKGKNTVTAIPDGTVYCNTTGNAGMAKGGSGDVLAGMMASLLAQGVSAEDAAICAVYLHGVAGDKTANELTQISMLPSDLIAKLPEVFCEIT